MSDNSGFDKSLRFGTVVALTVVFVLVMTYFWQPVEKSESGSINTSTLKEQAHHDELAQTTYHMEGEAPLESVLPNYEMFSKRQFVQATPLKKADLLAQAEEEGVPAEAPMVVMDKVVVIPKVIHHQAEKKKSNIEKKSIQSLTAMATHKKLDRVSQYTIQVMAGRNMAQLKRFSAQYHLDRNMHIFRGSHQGTPWYILAIGEYASYDDAKQAVTRLPTNLVVLKPWVRSLKDSNLVVVE